MSNLSLIPSLEVDVLEAQITTLLTSVLEGCRKDIKLVNAVKEKEEKNVKEAIVATEKIPDGLENFDGWLPLTLNLSRTYDFNLQQLRMIREATRVACTTNEVCKNVLKHYVNHIIGAGLTYDVLPVDFGNDPNDLVDASKLDNKQVKRLKKNWVKFCADNNFHLRTINMVERALRDGECPIRIFDTVDGPKIRFVEANFLQPVTMNNAGKTYSEKGYNYAYFGVATAPDDIENILFYGYQPYGLEQPEGKDIPAKEMIFIKRNTDFESLRGIPDFWSVAANLRRIEKLLVNVSTLASIQSSIALIRKHKNQTMARVQGLVNRQNAASNQSTNNFDPVTQTYRTPPNGARKMKAGTILDAPEGTEYDFPAHTIESKNFLEIVHEELAHVAANFVLPVDWLLCADPPDPLSPGSPSVANFRKEQTFFYTHITDLFWKVQEICGVNVKVMRQQYELNISGPHLAVGKALDQARVQQILQQCGASSPPETASTFGLNWAIQRAQTIRHRQTRQPGEVMPGDLGNTQPGENNGLTKKDGGTRTDGATGGNQKQ